MSEALRARVYDPSWKYVKKDETDIRKTFARFRKQQKEAAQSTVTPIKRQAK